MTLNIAIIGYGYWGPNLARNFAKLSGASVVGIVDRDPERRSLASSAYPEIEVVNDLSELSTQPQAVVIATPVHSHAGIALDCLRSGMNVLVEKPLSISYDDALAIKAEAEKSGLLAMVDHTFLYTGAVQKIKELTDSGEIGDLNYIDSTRINLGLFQNDVDVFWDLAPHDLSIAIAVIPSRPVSVHAIGACHTSSGLANMGFLIVGFENGCTLHINVSWVSPVKMRNMIFGGDKKMILYNDMEPSEKIRVYDSGYDITEADEKRKCLVEYRMGDIFVPKISQVEALYGVASDFVNSIANKGTPISNIDLGCEVVRILEAAKKSIETGLKVDV